MRRFDSLSEREILALAISLEEDDERTYADYAEGLRENFAASAAVIVVPLELAAITWMRHHYMDTPPLSAALQVGPGGALVFVTGVPIGNA
jgi:hypothetical protein